MPAEAHIIGILEEQIHQHGNFSNCESCQLKVCNFTGINSLSDLVNLFRDSNCRKHSLGFTIFLCLFNILILICGLIGNSVVIYVVIRKIKKKTASSWFILNLAVADLLVIICCIPATLLANILTPWIIGGTMCFVVAYAQGVSVFCSVFSLVAITFDRGRAIHQSIGLSPNISTPITILIIILIWIIGLGITLPWALTFKLEYMIQENTQDNYLPFCVENWETKSYEILYFLLIHVSACFILPFVLIAVCNFVIRKSVKGVRPASTVSSATSLSVDMMTSAHRDRKLRVLKMFSWLTFVFFICWLPLYVVVAWVKLFYNQNSYGYSWERKVIDIWIPIAQLLAACNSCVNPIMYALLNQTFKESFRSLCVCSKFCFVSSSPEPAVTEGNNSGLTHVTP